MSCQKNVIRNRFAFSGTVREYSPALMDCHGERGVMGRGAGRTAFRGTVRGVPFDGVYPEPGRRGQDRFVEHSPEFSEGHVRQHTLFLPADSVCIVFQYGVSPRIFHYATSLEIQRG